MNKIRHKFVLAYDGTAYSGWQIQCKPKPPPTVQGAVEAALFTLLNEPVRVTASGRTDAGVHALGQVAHADISGKIQDLRHSLNAVLPLDIRVLSAIPVAAKFHARKDAIDKTYIYDFWTEESFTPPLWRNSLWACGNVDINKMRSALPYFSGWHDFASFQNAGTEVRTTERQILHISLDEMPRNEYLPFYKPAFRLTIRANGFLKQMVRNIAGFLYHVGKNKCDVESLGEIFAARDRSALPSPTAPARGLSLACVNYGDLFHESSS